jgi:glutamate--cysteine ligase
MTVLHAAEDASDHAEPLTVDAAYARCHRLALRESDIGAVGLEIETHLVNLDEVAARVPWHRVDPMPESVRQAAGRSAITLEPGAQLELSGPPAPNIVEAITELRRDGERARQALAELHLGVAHAGADPLRPSRRVNPKPRYRAMEQHYAATGRAAPAAVMMTSTAAIQVNLQAGPRQGWPERVARAHRIGPTMIAISASSQWLHSRDTHWKSARQRAWNGLGELACGPVPGCVAPNATQDNTCDPAQSWANYALRAPVVFVRTPTTRNGDDVTAVKTLIPFEQWASGQAQLGGRAPTAADLDVHLTTIFPPIRMRGYLELRYLDMTAPRWWPAIAAMVTTLMDDPVAADLATEATERTAALWTTAARDGLGDPRLAESARRCVCIAADRAPAALSTAVADLAELVESGRCPGDLLAERIAQIGPHAAFEELAHA